MSDQLSPTGALVAALVARMLVKVEQFNTQVRLQAVPSAPQPLSPEQYDRTAEALNEEITELGDACKADDVLEAADAIIDMMFFGLGRLAEMGVPANAVFEAVATANMKKVPGTKDTRPTWAGSDAVKPAGWTPPDHSWLLDFSLADVNKARAYDEMSPVHKRLATLRSRKGSDYNNVPGGRDAYFPFGHASYAHMLNTKNLRIQSLVATMMAGGGPPNFEGIKDSVDDLINYATFYAEAMEDGRIVAMHEPQQEVSA